MFGAVLRLRTDIWDRMKMAFSALGLDVEEQYRKIYSIKEPLGAKYVSASRDYQEKIAGKLKSTIQQAEMEFGFPKHISTKEIDKSVNGQISLLSYV